MVAARDDVAAGTEEYHACLAGGPGGQCHLAAHGFDGERARVYPGTSVRRAIDLSRVPAGGYKALLVADAGEDNVYGATYTLEIER